MKALLFLCFALSFVLGRPPLDGPFVGIDLGTTFSVVGTWIDGAVEIIPNELGNRVTPSVVAFTEEEILVGDEALNQQPTNPENTIFAIKRLFGRKFDDLEVQRDLQLLPYRIIEDKESGTPVVQVRFKREIKHYTPKEIFSFIFVKMKTIAETHIGKEVKRAIITCPAYFTAMQRSAIKDAATIAGLYVLRIMDEPTAAAIAYRLNFPFEGNILVFHLGGGTLDVSLLYIEDGFLEVISTAGDAHLGGEDFDTRLMNQFLQILMTKHGADLRENKRALARLRRACEQAKRQLSSLPEARIEVKNLTDGLDFSEKLTRTKFEEINLDLFKKTLEPVQQVLKNENLDSSKIDYIVLIGGSTRIPKVQALLKEFFGGKELNRGVNPDEAIAQGAIEQACLLTGLPYPETVFQWPKVPRSVLMDPLSLSLGVETAGGIMSRLIERNTPIPAKKSKMFSTNADNQQTLLIQVYEGERAKTKDNRLLGKFELTGIPPQPRGKPKIEVRFEIDENGILQVSAKDKDAGITETITINKDKGNLRQEEIDRLVKEAEEFEAQDKEVRERTEERNALETFAYNLRLQINDEERLGSKLSEQSKQTIDSAVQEVLSWLDHNPSPLADDSREKYKFLERTCKPLIEEVYKRKEESSGGGEGAGGEAGGGDAAPDDEL
eukprot:RCo018622